MWYFTPDGGLDRNVSSHNLCYRRIFGEKEERQEGDAGPIHDWGYGVSPYEQHW